MNASEQEREMMPAGKPSSHRVVRVLPDVPAIDKLFDYVVPDRIDPDTVTVGTMVRIELHGRRVGGWVVADRVEPPPGVELKPVAKVTGYGPTPDVIDLARWAAHRWYGRVATLLTTASPPRAVVGLPTPEVASSMVAQGLPDELIDGAFDGGTRVIQLPPGDDVYGLCLAAVARGNALIVAPSVAEARHLRLRLRRSGVAASLVPDEWARAAVGGTVIGARASVFAPVDDLAAVLVIDEHDEVHQEERMPTWNARDVAVERARRAGVPCVLVSPAPSLEAREHGSVAGPSRRRERDGWPLVEVIDRRADDPTRGGLFPEKLVPWLRREGRVVCVLNRTGRSRLLACARCGELVRSSDGREPMVMVDQDLVAPRSGESRPSVCAECGATALKNLRLGITRAREELEALLGEQVVEVSGATAGSDLPEARVYIGTEAVLHQVPDAAVVAFLDFDQELLAPRYRAGEQALGLIVRAARLLGGRQQGGRLVVLTRQPRHVVIQAALHADPSRVAASEAETRRLLGLPPFGVMAQVSGASGPSFIEALGSPLGVEVQGPSDDAWLLRAPDHATLADALAAVRRPSGRFRVEVDPLRV
ncbi:MAG: hypothetical protein GY713_13135 [Actinomycetia bacterium]|nr:hypothetical protein [Actinomycetes bacterium]